MVWHIIRAKILLIVNVILTDRIRMCLNTLTKKQKPIARFFFFCSGIINLLFDGLAYNTSGHFAHCSYPHVLYAKPSNKVYVFLLSFAVVLPFTHVGVFLFAVIIYQWDQNMEQSFKNRVAAAAREYCAKAQCFPNQSR